MLCQGRILDEARKLFRRGLLAPGGLVLKAGTCAEILVESLLSQIKGGSPGFLFGGGVSLRGEGRLELMIAS